MLDINSESFAPMPSKAVKVLASFFHNEVIQQYAYAHEENDSFPCPKPWSIVKFQEWLDRHPIKDGVELYDLEAEIAKYRIVAEKAVAEREKVVHSPEWWEEMAREIPHAFHDARTCGSQ